MVNRDSVDAVVNKDSVDAVEINNGDKVGTAKKREKDKKELKKRKHQLNVSLASFQI